MSALVATRKVYVTANDSLATRTIFDAGESALILGFYVFTLGDTVSLNDAEGNPIFKFVGLVGGYFVKMPFILDEGMVFSSASGLTSTNITVLYRPNV